MTDQPQSAYSGEHIQLKNSKYAAQNTFSSILSSRTPNIGNIGTLGKLVKQ
jgi:hypothetical protein